MDVGRILWRGALVAALGSLAAAAPAAATIPTSLTSSCASHTPAPGFSYTFCDDGVPPFGGTTPNPTGAQAVTVPAKYGGDGFTGLPAQAPDAVTVPGADATGQVALDTDLSYPTSSSGPLPLIVFMHGCCSGDKTGWEDTSFDGGGEHWHYNNAWFASRGYVVINYTARGFVDSNGHGSTGETHLDSRNYEINDYQSLACQVTDLFNTSASLPDIDPSRVVVTGGSYGGGFSWLALTDPKWHCAPPTTTGSFDMSLAAVAPKYGWTDLLYSLVPTGTQFGEPSRLPATNGCDSGPRRLDGTACSGSDPQTPVGIPKQSIDAALYASGKTGIPPGSAHTTFPTEIDEAEACLTGSYPSEQDPLCANTLANTLPEFLRERSAYYQNQFFANIASDPSYRIPVFDAATLTDPLFTAIENRRMINRLEAVGAANGFNYPVQAYYGDYQHFTQNKARIWGDVCGTDHHVCNNADFAGNFNADPSSLVRTGVTTRLNRFIDHYAQPPADPSAPQPNFDVTAELQVCDQNTSSLGVAPNEGGPQFTAPTFEQLAPGVLNLDLRGSQTTTSSVAGNTHAVDADPVKNTASNGSKCVQETSAAGPGVATYTSGPLSSDATMIGATQVTANFTATDPQSLQLDARLYDVAPDGTAVLVDRGPRRVRPAEANAGQVTFELNGNGWRFPAGHSIRIELAQDASPYLHSSAPPSSATISRVQLAIPTHEAAPPPTPKSANVAVSVEDRPDPTTVGKGLRYDVILRNQGPDTAEGVKLKDKLPRSVSLGAKSGSASCQVSGRTVSCSLGTLKSGKSTKARIVVVPTRRGRIVDTATVSSDTPDPTADDNTTTATTKVRPASGPCRHLIAGTSGDDRLKGTKRGDLIRAGAGNDVLSGRGGTDCLYAASGQDRLSGGPGRDRLFGGAGHDVIHAVGGGRDVVHCEPADKVFADRHDRLHGCRRDN